jgi:hypothetical protein
VTSLGSSRGSTPGYSIRNGRAIDASVFHLSDSLKDQEQTPFWTHCGNDSPQTPDTNNSICMPGTSHPSPYECNAPRQKHSSGWIKIVLYRPEIWSVSVMRLVKFSACRSHRDVSWNVTARPLRSEAEYGSDYPTNITGSPQAPHVGCIVFLRPV